MATRTRFVFLMHPKEYKQEKAATGRLTRLCLTNSELHMGIAFDEHEAVQDLIRDPMNLPVLLYPGRDALNLSDPYLHNGSKNSVEDVLRFYVRLSRLARAGQVRNVAPELSGILLEEADVAPLAAFLRALSEDYE